MVRRALRSSLVAIASAILVLPWSCSIPSADSGGEVATDKAPAQRSVAPSMRQTYTPLSGRLYFFAQDHEHHRELWRSDGTAAGTVLVKDIHPGPEHSHPQGLTEASGTLFFWADDGIHGYELWKSDGTARERSW